MKRFLKGITQGIPIALGYLSVSFGFGIMAGGSCELYVHRETKAQQYAAH